MSRWKPATWVNRKTGKTLSGHYLYVWASNYFAIDTDGKNPRRFRVHGDTPEWGNWDLVRDAECSVAGDQSAQQSSSAQDKNASTSPTT